MLWRTVLCLLLLLGSATARHGSQYVNNGAPVGTNFAGIAPQEWPFFNAMKMGQQWYTYSSGGADTNEEWYLYANCLDTNGYWSTPTCPTGTFTASISGTTMVVTAVGSAVAPWLGGTLTGTGVTAGTKIVGTFAGSGNGHISGTTLTIDNSGASWTVGQQVFGYGVADNTFITVDTGGGGGNGTYTVSVSQTTASAGTPTVLNGTQLNGRTGTYLVSANQNVSSTTITEAQTFAKILVQPGLVVGTTSSPYYPGGASSWLMIYDGDDAAGSSNFAYTGIGGDITSLVSHNCSGGTCTDTLSVTPSGNGLKMFLTSPNPNGNANYVKNIRLVQAAQYNALTAAQKAEFNAGASTGSTKGIFFNPDWLAIVAPFRTVRTMPWSSPNNSQVTTWSQRSTPEFVFWNDNIAHYQDAPWEVIIAAANQINANLWVSLPFITDSTYNTNLATMVLRLLNPSRNAYVEKGNEIFNFPAFGGYTNNGPRPHPTVLELLVTQGLIDFPAAGPPYCGGSYGSCATDEYVYQMVKMADDWATVWTGADAARMFPVAGGQMGNDGLNVFTLTTTTPHDGSGSLWTGTSGSHMRAVADAPYFMYGFVFPYGVPNAWTGNPDGGVDVLYNDVMYGTGMPHALVTGNCGNGAGITCGTSTAYTLTTGQSLTGTPPNGKCVGFTTNQASGNNPTIAVDSVAATPIQSNDGAGWKVNALTGASWAATGGGQVTFTTTTSHYVTPGVQFVVSGMTPSGYNGTYAAIAGTTGSTIVAAQVSNPGASSVLGQLDANVVSLANASVYVICWTSRTADGAQTGVWQTAGRNGGSGTCISEFDCTRVYLTTAAATAAGVTGRDGQPIRLFLYEGGQNWTLLCPNAGYTLAAGGVCGNPLAHTLRNNLADAIQLSPQIAQMYMSFMQLFKDVGAIEFQQFNDPGIWSSGAAYWGFSPSTYHVGQTPRQQALYDYNRSRPCWWTNCR